MTPTFYLLLFSFLFFLLNVYFYIYYKNEEKFKLACEDNQKTNHLNDSKHSVSVKKKDSFVGKQHKSELIKSKKNVELKLKKYNKQLNRSLKTLTYISIVEADSLKNKGQLKDLLNLKENVQYEVIRITKQINYCKSIIGESIPV